MLLGGRAVCCFKLGKVGGQRSRHMNYATQAVICLCDDLQNGAQARQAKREEVGQTSIDG